MKISVIIPTYKPAKYIHECLSSLKAQTLIETEFEVLIILNGCKEPWYSELFNFVKEEMVGLNVRLIQIDSPGVSNARNIGMENSGGEYIAFIDDDDRVSPNYLENLLAAMGEQKHVVVVSNFYSFDEKNEIHGDYVHDAFIRNKTSHAKSLIKSRGFLSAVHGKLISKEIIGNKKFSTTMTNGEDTLFMTEISNKIKEIWKTSDDTIYWRRIRAESASRKKRSIWNHIKNKSCQISRYILLALQPWRGYDLRFVWFRIIGAFLK